MMTILIANSLTFVPVLVGMTPRIWFSVPLVVAISLVYGATRHENLREIFVHAMRSAVWVFGFMAIIFFIIWVGGFWN